MSQPEFSYVIATRNEKPEILAATVKGLWSPGVEIVIIDDASDPPVSSEDLPNVAWRLKRNHERCGIARSRNIGAEMAKGRTLIFTDAHVAFSPNWLDGLRSSGVAEGQGIRGCEVSIIHHPEALKAAASNGRLGRDVDVIASYHGWKLVLEPTVHVEPITLDPSTEPWQSVPYVGGATYAISRDLFHQLGGFSSQLVGCGCAGDLELACRCWSAGLPVKSTRQATCYHYSAGTVELPDYIDPLSHRDIPRYPGSTTNFLRILLTHFPLRVFFDACQTMQLSTTELRT